MSEPIGTPETSMEVILASIRRIIAEDGIQPPPGVRPAPLARPEPSSQPNPPVAEPSPPPPSPPPSPAAAQPAPPPRPVLTMPLIVQEPAVTPKPASQPPAPAPVPAPDLLAPQAVWGVLGDRAGAGEELVLTQMVTVDGSVVPLAKRGSPAAASSQPPSEPLDVLLLTDALPGSMPDIAMPVTPLQKVEPPAAPIPAPAPIPAAVPAAGAPPIPAPPVSPPRPAAKPATDADRPRVGLAAPETLVTSAAVLEQLARVRSQVRASSPNPPAASITTANLEELVRQSLEPKIQEWLNANLLQIVERLVQQEIDRISSRT